MVNSEVEFFISDKKIKLEDEEGNYIFWVAFLNSENEENERSIRTMYGYTELLPGQITADTLISSDGNSYMDFLLNKFRIGDKNSSLDWNVSKDEQLSIKNANFEISNSEGEVISKIDGESGAAMFGKGTNLFDGLGNAVLGNLSHHFFADGNFNIAKNNLTYDESTNQLIISGKFESNKDGNKIVIDPITRLTTTNLCRCFFTLQTKLYY